MTKRPNIVFIMSDDHAAQAISSYSGRLNKTPNIDRLATEGMRHDATYVTNSICTPSRAAILTGTYNHVNCVTTLDTPIDNRLPNVAKLMRADGYRTAMIGKWHLGEGKTHEPTGFDEWCVLPEQGEYFDPMMIDPSGARRRPGYVTDIIADMSIDFIKRNKNNSFFLMCHNKAPHRNFEPNPKHNGLWEDEDLPVPETFNDDYSHRAAAAAAAKMRIRSDLSYADLGLVQPPGGAAEVGELMTETQPIRKVPELRPGESISVMCAETGKQFTFTDPQTFAEFKYQRYMKRYLRTVHSIDENVGRILDCLDAEGLTDDTVVIYTSDQGFFLGEHGWFDKRFMYEESLQMPFLIRYPRSITAGSTSKAIASNVDFAPTFLDYAGLPVPSYMQGHSLKPLFEGREPDGWQEVAYHRYWMHNDDAHEAYAHYGVRDGQYKLIYWYNDDLGQPGARANGAPPEWELFDCENDPHELMNQAGNPAYRDVFIAMLKKLDTKMAEIGDIPEHDSASVVASLENTENEAPR